MKKHFARGIFARSSVSLAFRYYNFFQIPRIFIDLNIFHGNSFQNVFLGSAHILRVGLLTVRGSKVKAVTASAGAGLVPALVDRSSAGQAHGLGRLRRRRREAAADLLARAAEAEARAPNRALFHRFEVFLAFSFFSRLPP